MLVGPTEANSLSVAVPSDVYADYLRFLKHRSPKNITDFSGPHSRRDVVEVVLFEQALRLGGWQGDIHFRQVNSYQRIQRLLESGSVAASATTVFRGDLKDSPMLLASPTVVYTGEFVAGIYVRYNNPLLHDPQLSAETIKQLRLVSSKQWRVDWYTLEHSGFSQIINANKWQSQVKLVDAGRADALLAPFQANEAMLLEAFGAKLLPLPNYKLVLQDSRHFVISEKASQHQEIYQALLLGLNLLREKGIVNKAYRQAGFFNPAVSDWTVVN